jgi:eukaryotic-like serine/threonine-protein kinase
MAESIGTFKIISELGKGAHSTIYHIRRESDQRQFALKVVPIDEKEDMKFYDQAAHELRVGQMLEHVNLIKVHTLETQRDWLFRVKKVHLLIEYVNGKTLDQTIKLTYPRLMQVFAKIAAGLMHMHRRGVFHADLKPNNIMLSRAGEVKILDYGLAWIKGESKERVQGTPEYMAPEQSKHSVANEKTDIYNFGATMYRLTTGKLPPSTVPEPGGPGMNRRLFRTMFKPVEELVPKVPTMLATIINRSLEYEPKDRPERVGQILDELNRLVEEFVLTDDDRLEALGW